MISTATLLMQLLTLFKSNVNVLNFRLPKALESLPSPDLMFCFQQPRQRLASTFDMWGNEAAPEATGLGHSQPGSLHQPSKLSPLAILVSFWNQSQNKTGKSDTFYSFSNECNC